MRLRHLVAAGRQQQKPLLILDAGGRKSPYTVGLEARVLVADLPRNSEELNLGFTQNAMESLVRKRSNVGLVLLNDMTRCSLRSETADGIVAVEVLEHVEEDAAFVAEVARVLKPGGFFLMTTPNGDYKTTITNPDHKRHYRKADLEALLGRYLDRVEIEYAGPGGKLRNWGRRSWSARKPVATALSMGSNLINQIRSTRAWVPGSAHGTHHLFAVAWKAGSGERFAGA
jgi:2-polyprenyl-3-methyl-5-hydroxy-6-metoxy-1,4-benzoquinol methylase